MESLREKIDKNEVTPKQVIEAAIKQLKSTPTLLEIAYQEEVLPQDQLARLVIKASESNSDFLSILREEVSDIGTLLEKKRSQSRPLREIVEELLQETIADEKNREMEDDLPTNNDEPVSDAAMDSLKELIESGQIDADALNDFKQEDETEDSETRREQQVEENEGDQGISDAALESLKEQVEAGVISPEALEEFQPQGNSSSSPTSKQLNQDEINQLIQILSKSLLHELSIEFKGLTSQNGKDLKLSLENLKDKFDSLTELTTNLKTPHLRDLCQEMSNKIQSLRESPQNEQDQSIALYKLFALIVKMKKGIVETGLEDPIFHEPSFNQTLGEIRKKFT